MLHEKVVTKETNLFLWVRSLVMRGEPTLHIVWSRQSRSFLSDANDEIPSGTELATSATLETPSLAISPIRLETDVASPIRDVARVAAVPSREIPLMYVRATFENPRVAAEPTPRIPRPAFEKLLRYASVILVRPSLAAVPTRAILDPAPLPTRSTPLYVTPPSRRNPFVVARAKFLIPRSAIRPMPLTPLRTAPKLRPAASFKLLRRTLKKIGHLVLGTQFKSGKLSGLFVSFCRVLKPL